MSDETEEKILTDIEKIQSALGFIQVAIEENKDSIKSELYELKSTMELITKENAVISELIQSIDDKLKGKDSIDTIRLR